jgi:hypothetical protein
MRTDLMDRPFRHGSKSLGTVVECEGRYAFRVDVYGVGGVRGFQERASGRGFFPEWGTMRMRPASPGMAKRLDYALADWQRAERFRAARRAG